MNIHTIDGENKRLDNLTADEVVAETEKALADPETRYIEIFTGPNRRERRRQNKLRRKQGAKARTK